MAISKSMDSPIKKSNYALRVEQSQENTLSFLPVPGPQGEKGPKGEIGPTGATGPVGPKGEKGNPGKNGIDGINGTNGLDGKNGKDGKSMTSPSGQMIGWAYYENSRPKDQRTGIDKGDDGWVSLLLSGLSNNSREDYLPYGNVSLWNKTTERLNFKTLSQGAIVTVCYNISLTTYMTNTEVWFKTFLGNEERSPLSYVGNLKYQYEYDFSVEQKVFVESQEIKIFGGIPQIRTDNPCEAILKSIYVSVS
jgi:hypothetical protein